MPGVGTLGTRAQILNAAERLFAKNGIAATSNTQVLERSKQRNQSALHYHFGSRTGLVDAIFDRHLDRIEAARWDVLTDLDAADSVTTTDVVRALVEPVAECLRTTSGRNYLQLVPEVMRGHNIVARSVKGRPAMREVVARLDAQLGHLSPPLRSERIACSLVVLTDVLAARARQHRVRSKAKSLNHELFVENLVLMVTGALESPSP
jgi:AcrR family transcriptional regulator